ncbi:MAG TPA: YjbQ family protein, partial [Pseudonocardiaceae bacterium]
MHSEEIEIRTGSEEVVHDLTRDCQRFVDGVAGDAEGVLHVWVPHA